MGLKLNKKAAPSNPSANKLELYYDQTGTGTPGARAIQAIDEAGNVAMLAHFNTLDYRLIKVRILTSSTSYVPTEGTRAIYVECIGGGGQGGGATATTTGNASVGTGGSSGGYSASWLTGASVKNPTTYQIGAGGTTGTTGTGQAGTNTLWDTNVIIANGGPGGLSLAVGTTVIGAIGGAAATAGTGDLACAGATGGLALRLSIAAGGIISGMGGCAPIGGGEALPVIGTSAAGTNGNVGANYGGGGSGAAAWATGSTVNGNGGNGANGMIRVFEFA